jgi:hypothetical protein
MAPQSKQEVYDEIMGYITQLKADVSVQIEVLKSHLATEKNNEHKAQMKALISALSSLEPLLLHAASIQMETMEKELPAFIETLMTQRKKIGTSNLDALIGTSLSKIFDDAKFNIINEIIDMEEKVPPLLEPYYNWSAFQKGHGQSPVDLTQQPRPSRRKNIGNDFTRSLDIITINGTSLRDYSTTYDFENTEERKQFLKEVFLSSVTADEEQLNNMVAYLEENLHQDGLLYPVTSSLQRAMIAPVNDPINQLVNDQRQVNIITTNKGFKIQEYIKFGQMKIFDGQSKKNPLMPFADDRGELKAEVPGEPILKAEGVVDVDFIANPEKPTLGAESSTINYGHAALRQEMAYRNPLQMLYDYLVSLVFDTNIVVKPLQQTEMKADLKAGRDQNQGGPPSENTPLL